MPPPTDTSLTLFVDRSLGAHDVPAALRAAGAAVQAHDDHFAPDTPDTAWLADVGARGWVVLTKDNRIRRHPLELQALEAAQVAAFMLTGTGLTGAEMGGALVATLPKITALARSRARPFIATISRAGRDHSRRCAAWRDSKAIAALRLPCRPFGWWPGCTGGRLDGFGNDRVSQPACVMW